MAENRSRRRPGARGEPEAAHPSAAIPELDGSDPDRQTGEFVPAALDKTVIAVPLLKQLRADADASPAAPAPATPSTESGARAAAPELYSVIIDLNNEYRGEGDARARVADLVARAVAERGRARRQGIDEAKSALSEQYVFARLEGPVIQEVVRLDNEDRPAIGRDVPGGVTGHRAIHSIWPDFEIKALLTKSHVTVKADAAWTAFTALGDGIVWAVLDSGIDDRHPHFARHQNLLLTGRLAEAHRDFTGSAGGPLRDEFGHGTHVAGIMAGQMTAPVPAPAPRPRRRTPRPPAAEAPDVPEPEILAYARQRDERGRVTRVKLALDKIAGIAPKCKLVSVKVLDDGGRGEASSLIVALEHIQRLNNQGRRLRVHGVNMSVGYSYDPEWFACGQSPLCVEVDRLVRSGVAVVVAAGNTGYGWLQAAFKPQPVPAGMDLSINDPGNAELAITVGSTHRESPHVYGVSYFSSKGPTGDGRAKPDLVAPGEKILSCAAGEGLRRVDGKAGQPVYVEDSGTSMAAPHVAGVVAAFLSVRREFIGRPEVVKEIVLGTATDLKRDRHFQGRGLVDLMRALQAV